MNSFISERFLLKRIVRITSLLLLTAVLNPSVALADDPAVLNTAPIERYLDDNVAVIGWLDLSQLDIDAVVHFLENIFPDNGPLPERKLQQSKQIQAALVQLGVTRVFWVGDLTELTAWPKTIIVPTSPDNRSAVKRVLESIATGLGGTAAETEDAVLIGTTDSVGNLQQARNVNLDADFLSIVNDLSDPHGFAIRTSGAVLRPFAGMLPGILYGDSNNAANASELLLKIQGITISGSLPPTSGRLLVVTDDSETATKLSKLANDWTTKRIGKDASAIQLTVNGSTIRHTTSTATDATATIESLKKLIAPARNATNRKTTMNSLKQIALAMHNFHDIHGYFAPQALVDEKGKRLLSWRVLILPFIEQVALYNRFHLDEPWNSEHNKTLIAKMPAIYQSHTMNHKPLPPGTTRMVAPLAEHTLFGRPGQGVAIQEIIDGTSNTLMVVEARPEAAVIWTRPEDLPIDEESPNESLIGKLSKGFLACMCDGSARFFPNTIDNKTLRALLTIDGGEVIKD